MLLVAAEAVLEAVGGTIAICEEVCRSLLLLLQIVNKLHGSLIIDHYIMTSSCFTLQFLCLVHAGICSWSFLELVYA